MNNNCWYKLNIDTKGALKDPFPLIKSSNHGVWNPTCATIFNQEWINYMISLGLPMGSHAMVFYRGPNYKSFYAHVDVVGGGGGTLTVPSTYDEASFVSFGINWVWGGKDNAMVWYNFPKEKNEILYTSANTPFINYRIDKLNEIDRYNIQQDPILTRIDVPHNIEVGNEERWCVSVRLRRFLSKMSWDETVEFMRSNNFLIER